MNLVDEKIHERILAKKLQLDSDRPLSKEIVGQLRRNMEIEYTYNSNAIEGNTLTLRETQLVIREGVTISGKSLNEHLEAKNHPKAIEYVENLAESSSLSQAEVLKVHEIIFSGILENVGNYRNGQVYIEGSEYMPPPAFEVPCLMRELLNWLEKNPQELRPIEKAAVFHYRLVAIHPFDDGNGRAARLMMNLVLIRHGYPVTVIKNVDRRRYYDTLRKADGGDPKPFVNFIACCVERSLDLCLNAVEPSTEENKLLSLAEAAKLTPYSQEYLSLLARRGLVAATKMGKDWHVTPKALEDYLRNVQHRNRKSSASDESGRKKRKR
jgi:Fic family protein